MSGVVVENECDKDVIKLHYSFCERRAQLNLLFDRDDDYFPKARGDETKDGDERVIKRDGELLFIIIIIIINAIRAVSTSVGTCNRQAITERTE